MRIALGADHAGLDLKESLRGVLAGRRTRGLRPGDVRPVPARRLPGLRRRGGPAALQQGQAERGILLCGSGVGVSVAANKIPGIRAGLCHDTYSAHQGVEHDHMNILVLGARVIGPALAEELVGAFLHASPSHEARHERRLRKIQASGGRPAAIPGGREPWMRQAWACRRRRSGRATAPPASCCT